MKRIAAVLLMVLSFSITSYAGQWQQDEQGWRYQNDDGTYKKGWHQDVDGTWYYLDDITSYMLVNTVTPDGYKVSDTGTWIEESDKLGLKTGEYQNITDITVSAYMGPGRARSLGYSVPVKVYYNESYDNLHGGTIKITSVEASKEGIGYLSFNVDTDINFYSLRALEKYVKEDGTIEERIDDIMAPCKNGGEDVSSPLLTNLREFKDFTPTSIEIYINAVTENK